MSGSSAPLDRDVLDQLRMRARSHVLVAEADFERTEEGVRDRIAALWE